MSEAVLEEEARRKPLRAEEMGERLGLSPRAVNYLLEAYERVFGPLPRKGRVRLMAKGDLGRLEKALELMRDGKVFSYLDAFRVLKGEKIGTRKETIWVVLSRVLEELERRREPEGWEVALALLKHLKEEVGELRREVEALRLILYGAGFEEVALANAEVRNRLRPVPWVSGPLSRGESYGGDGKGREGGKRGMEGEEEEKREVAVEARPRRKKEEKKAAEEDEERERQEGNGTDPKDPWSLRWQRFFRRTREEA